MTKLQIATRLSFAALAFSVALPLLTGNASWEEAIFGIVPITCLALVLLVLLTRQSTGNDGRTNATRKLWLRSALCFLVLGVLTLGKSGIDYVAVPDSYDQTSRLRKLESNIQMLRKELDTSSSFVFPSRPSDWQSEVQKKSELSELESDARRLSSDISWNGCRRDQSLCGLIVGTVLAGLSAAVWAISFFIRSESQQTERADLTQSRARQHQRPTRQAGDPIV